MNTEIESVARAFYDVEDDALIWDREPEILKEEFRRLAREAIALLKKQEREESQEAVGAYEYPYAA